MIRLIGIDLQNNKKILYSLTQIYGIGLSSSKKILKIANISFEKITLNLTLNEITSLRNILADTNLKLEGDLKKFNILNIKRLSEINCYRGKRHRNNLPVRGQRTRTNNRTQRKLKRFI